MKKEKMIIEIKGGNVQNVFTNLDVEIQIKDFDLQAIGENGQYAIKPEPLELFTKQ